MRIRRVSIATTRIAARVASAAVLLGAVGCSGRIEVVPGTTNGAARLVPLRANVPNQVDVLFMIDNSAGMGDKQAYLASAVPDLIGRLVQPNCLKADGVTIDGPSSADGMGTCPAGDSVEFVPVHDMHIGVVTSALGPRGGDECAVMTPDATHQDDRGELIDRGGPAGSPIADMTASSYLAWFPPTEANYGRDPGPPPSVTSAMTLESDFSDLVAGVHQTGCGLESQLESWYRFLIQPDPYLSIAVNDDAASWFNVDTTLLAQRHDFLRPNSLVVIVDLTDENDSEIDVRALGQQGYNWMISTFDPPRGTMACLTNPADPGCTSCAINSGDPNCANGNFINLNDWGFNVNLRHVHMKSKYGLDLQFPMSRYVNGLTGSTVPDRDGEYPTSASGQMAVEYVGTNDCTNPLYAAALPDGSMVDKASLCMVPMGTRSTDLVFYAHIGGVPSSLLHFTPNDPAASALTAADWVKILGNDPDTFDYSGIDPHMIESYQPRAGLPDPTMADNADPANGREWITDTNPANNGNFVDLELACTFPLVTPRDCTDASNAASCSCPTTAGTTWGHSYVPPLCGGAGSLDPAVPQTTQIAAKAYPTIREIELANLMGAQGVLSSICPIHVADNATMDDPLYGYRPAVAAIVNRIESALDDACLPQPLVVQADESIDCEMLEALPTAADTCASHGFMAADPTAATSFAAQIRDGESSAVLGTPNDLSLNAICQVPQLTPLSRPSDFTAAGSCVVGSDPGWCYVTGAAAGTCDQTVILTSSGILSGAQVSLYCAPSVGTGAAP